MKTKIKIKKLSPEARIPSYAHDGDAGMDVYSCEDKILAPGERHSILTGLSFEIPKGFEIQVRSKSGLAANFGIMVLNSPGTLDSGYRGELKVILLNTSNKDYQVKKGEKVAQIILARYDEADIEEIKGELSSTNRGSGGLGSTGLT